MSDASIAKILARLDVIASQVAKMDDHIVQSDKDNADRLDRAVLLLREAAEMYDRKMKAFEDLRQRVTKLEDKTRRKRAA
jgi:hypothetical protein